MNDGKDLFYYLVIIIVVNYEIRFRLFYFIGHLIVDTFNHFLPGELRLLRSLVPRGFPSLSRLE